MSAVRGAGVVSACTAACTPESLLELCALDRACGLGCCAEPGSGVRPVFGVVTPHRRSNSARYFRVENSRCLGLPGAGGVEVMKGGFFLESCYTPKRAWRSMLVKWARSFENLVLTRAVYHRIVWKKRKVALNFVPAQTLVSFALDMETLSHP